MTQKPREGGFLGRVRDWFWRGSELSRVRRAHPEPGERSRAFGRRAQTCADLAANLAELTEPGEASAEGNALESYRQSSYWSLCALLAKTEPTLQPDDSARVWGTLDEALLSQAASSEPRVAGLQRALSAGSFVYFAELSADERTALLPELRKLAQALLAKLAERSAALDAVYQQRAWRLAFLGLLGFCLALTPAALKKVWEARSELSAGKPWRASSKLENGGGCNSPAQQCPESTGFFFHTNEEASPWVEFDLGKERKVSKVVVENRTDCCFDRANPLVIEVSADQKHWKKVARHDGEFTSWEAPFSPVQGRYVRVRLLKQSWLHFNAVRIY